MPLDLESVRVFVRVAEAKNLTRAAEQLGVPKGRVSHRLQALERDLGCELVQRSTRVLRLTEEGERFLARARPLLVEADELAGLFRPDARVVGRVRVDLPVALARRLVLPRLPELLDAHPDLELALSLSDRRVEALREGFDCVLRVGEAAAPGLVGRRLGALPMMNCASPAYLARYGTPQSLEDLDQHLLVNYSSTLSNEPPTFEHPSATGWAERPMRARVTVNNTDAYRAAALAGLGIVQLPRLDLSLPGGGELVEVLPEHPCAPMPVWLLHTHGRRLPARVRVVLDWVRAAVEPALRAEL